MQTGKYCVAFDPLAGSSATDCNVPTGTIDAFGTDTVRNRAHPASFDSTRHAGKYCVAFDPLDGSSNIDCNVSTGTIFAVYEKNEGSVGSIDDIMRAGIDLKVRCVKSNFNCLKFCYGVENVACTNKPLTRTK
jgi:fructose-1,6-bisphosphatase